ncbi:hypothetical protein TorRG33x02_298810, partial [Trema orientale]
YPNSLGKGFCSLKMTIKAVKARHTTIKNVQN